MKQAILIAIVTVALPARAFHTVMYAVDSSCDCLFTIDASGNKTVIGTGLAQDTGESFLTPVSMAVDLDGTAYAWNNTTYQLLVIDPATGDADALNEASATALIVSALAINPVDAAGPGGGTYPAGTLFGSTSLGLATIDKCTGTVDEVIGTIGLNIAGMDFDAAGTLYGAELDVGTNDRLVTISTVDASATLIGSISPGFDRVGMLVFDDDGTLWGSDISVTGPKLVEIDTSTATILSEIPLATPDVSGPLSPQGAAFGVAAPGACGEESAGDCHSACVAAACDALRGSDRAACVASCRDECDVGEAVAAGPAGDGHPGVFIEETSFGGTITHEPAGIVMDIATADLTIDRGLQQTSVVASGADLTIRSARGGYVAEIEGVDLTSVWGTNGTARTTVTAPGSADSFVIDIGSAGIAIDIPFGIAIDITGLGVTSVRMDDGTVAAQLVPRSGTLVDPHGMVESPAPSEWRVGDVEISDTPLGIAIDIPFGIAIDIPFGLHIEYAGADVLKIATGQPAE